MSFTSLQLQCGSGDLLPWHVRHMPVLVRHRQPLYLPTMLPHLPSRLPCLLARLGKLERRMRRKLKVLILPPLQPLPAVIRKTLALSAAWC